MKKIVGIIICALMAFCFVGCGEEVKEDPPMELMGKTITDEYEFAIIGNEDTEPITAKDVQGVYIIYKKGQYNSKRAFRFEMLFCYLIMCYTIYATLYIVLA